MERFVFQNCLRSKREFFLECCGAPSIGASWNTLHLFLFLHILFAYVTSTVTWLIVKYVSLTWLTSFSHKYFIHLGSTQLYSWLSFMESLGYQWIECVEEISHWWVLDLTLKQTRTTLSIWSTDLTSICRTQNKLIKHWGYAFSFGHEEVY